MPDGVKVTKKVRESLDSMRLKHRLTFAAIGRLANVNPELVRRVIRNGAPVRDVHAHALAELAEKYDRGEVMFEEAKDEVTFTGTYRVPK